MAEKKSARNEAVVAAVKGGSSMASVARKFGISSERVRQICSRGDRREYRSFVSKQHVHPEISNEHRLKRGRQIEFSDIAERFGPRRAAEIMSLSIGPKRSAP